MKRPYHALQAKDPFEGTVLGDATVRIHDEQGQMEREIAPLSDAQMMSYPSRALARASRNGGDGITQG